MKVTLKSGEGVAQVASAAWSRCCSIVVACQFPQLGNRLVRLTMLLYHSGGAGAQRTAGARTALLNFQPADERKHAPGFLTQMRGEVPSKNNERRSKLSQLRMTRAGARGHRADAGVQSRQFTTQHTMLPGLEPVA